MKKSNLCVIYSQRDDGYKFEDGDDRKLFGEEVVTSLPCYTTNTARVVKRIIHNLLSKERVGFSGNCKVFQGNETANTMKIIKSDRGTPLHKSKTLKYITSSQADDSEKQNLCLNIEGNVKLREKGKAILWSWNDGPPEEDDAIFVGSQKSLLTPECVYFIGNIKYGVVKIGFTRNLKERVSNISTYCWHDIYPLHMEYIQEGSGSSLEREYHKKYTHHHLRNEWFKIGALTEHLGLKNTSELWEWMKNKKSS